MKFSLKLKEVIALGALDTVNEGFARILKVNPFLTVQDQDVVSVSETVKFRNTQVTIS